GRGELTGEAVGIGPGLVGAVLAGAAAGRAEPGPFRPAGTVPSRPETPGPFAPAGTVPSRPEGRIEAPFLQLVLERIWARERDAGSPVLRLATLGELGGAEAIVRDHLRHALDALSPAEQDVAASMFGHLVTPSGTKIAHRSGDLAQYAAVREPELEPVLRALSGHRILR